MDLHARAEKQTFASARDVLCELLRALYPDAWHAESAYFFVGGSAPPERGCTDLQGFSAAGARCISVAEGRGFVSSRSPDDSRASVLEGG